MNTLSRRTNTKGLRDYSIKSPIRGARVQSKIKPQNLLIGAIFDENDLKRLQKRNVRW